MNIGRLTTAALLLAVSPSFAHACTCVIGGSPGLPLGTPTETRRVPPGPLGHWEGRDAIFVGQVLEVDPPDERPRVVRLVTETSWRGEMPDTVTVLVDGAPCVTFQPGERHIIAADIDSADTRRLISRECGLSYNVRTPAYTRLTGILGPPSWTAPPLGARALDAGAIRLGTRRPSSATPTSVVLIPTSLESIARYEIADYGGPMPMNGGSILQLEPGLYHIRITWPDGAVTQQYVSIRCERRPAEGSCRATRVFERPR